MTPWIAWLILSGAWSGSGCPAPSQAMTASIVRVGISRAAPVQPGAVGDLRGEVAPGDGDRGGGQDVHPASELRFAGGVAEQQPEPVRVRGGRAEQSRDGLLVEVVAADAVLELPEATSPVAVAGQTLFVARAV
jgi:hypothetical protein